MLPRYQPRLIAILFAASLSLEMALLGGVYTLSDGVYHGIHIALMTTLVASQLALYLKYRGQLKSSRYALWFAVALASTMIGDFVNGASSGVEPVTEKLTWALLFFGTGYAIYCLCLWRYGRGRASAATGGYRTLLIAAVVIAAANLIGWLDKAEPVLQGHDLLYWGSCIFNLTIYVALPALAFWLYRQSGWGTTNLLIFLGALLIPFSDLVLFASWLADGDPAVPARALYIANWPLYFGGQLLMSLFPASAMDAEPGARPPAAML